MTLRVLDTGINSARGNIAVTAAMLELRAAGGIPDTFRFHRYAKAFLLGRNQSVERELNVGRCLANGVEIARRLTGGATVYMDPNVLAWDFVSETRAFATRLAETSARVSSVVVAALARLGVPAHVDGFGDIIVDGWKVGGSAGCFESRSALLQGMVFLDLDRARMAGMLKKQSDTRRAGIRIAGLAEFLGRVPAVEEVKAAIELEMTDAAAQASAALMPLSQSPQHASAQA